MKSCLFRKLVLLGSTKQRILFGDAAETKALQTENPKRTPTYSLDGEDTTQESAYTKSSFRSHTRPRLEVCGGFLSWILTSNRRWNRSEGENMDPEPRLHVTSSTQRSFVSIEKRQTWMLNYSWLIDSSRLRRRPKQRHEVKVLTNI